jgi:hypothetical protein
MLGCRSRCAFITVAPSGKSGSLKFCDASAELAAVSQCGNHMDGVKLSGRPRFGGAMWKFLCN